MSDENRPTEMEEALANLRAALEPVRAFMLRHYTVLLIGTFVALGILAVAVQITEGRGLEVVALGVGAWAVGWLMRRS